MTINEDCINCNACAEECETGAIHESDDSHESTYIDQESCTSCKACQEVCPVDAIEG